MSDSKFPRPAQRKVGVRLLTPSGWVVGTLHVPKRESLVDYLNTSEAFYRLTNVSLPSQQETIPFMALQRDAVFIVVPGSDHRIETKHGPDEIEHEVTCLFEGGMVKGALALPMDNRVSDELMRKPDFYVLHNCTLALDGATEASMEAEELLIVHASRMFGVAELQQS